MWIVHTHRRIITELTAASVFLSGCSLAHLRPSQLIKPRFTLAVSIDGDANLNKPVAFDFVSINDKELAKEVSKMTAADWFQKRGQIRQDFPKEQSISVRSWEWVPGQVVRTIPVPMRKAPRAILVFANYSTPGPHRATIDAAKPVIVTLHREDMQLQPLAK